MTQSHEPSEPKPASRDLVAEVIARHFGVTSGELTVGEVKISDIAAEFGTPLFVYDRATLQRQWQALRDALPPRFDICYSVKANPNQAFLRFFVEHGCGLEIASSGELVQSLAAGCPAERILFAGPGKTNDELSLAIEHGIGEIHIESLNEARRLAASARQRGQTVRIALRINPASSVAGGGLRMGAKPAPFGIDEDQVDAVLDQLAGEPLLNVVGIHLYVGTQILDAEVLLAQYRAALDIARQVSAQLAKPLATIDLGGGLGVPYFSHEPWLDLTALKQGLAGIESEIANDPAFHGTRLIVEPGRFLVAEAGIYVARVVDVKVSRGKRYVVTDGGMHHHLAASGNLGQTIKRNFPVAVLNKLHAPNTESVTLEPVDVVGPLCTPLDVLARNLPLPPIEIGDLIGIFQSGAYARAASPLGFLSRQSPPEVLVAGEMAHLIRRRGSDRDALSDQPRLEGS
jgi:diaminopimelate decarboxylase